MKTWHRLPVEKQKKLQWKSLKKYLNEYVYPYHPYYRQLFQKEGINPKDIKTYEDFQKIPLTLKEDYRNDPDSFILQPKFPGREIKYDVEELSRKLKTKYSLEAFFNLPRDYANYFRRMSWEEKIDRRYALEWNPIHFHFSAGSTGLPTPAVYTHYEINRILAKSMNAAYMRPDNPDPQVHYPTFYDIGLNIFPGAPHLAFFEAVFAKIFAGCALIDTGGAAVVPTELQIIMCYQRKINNLAGIPSYLTYWLRKAIEMKKKGLIGDMPHLKRLLLAAEPVTPKLIEYMHNLLNELGADPKARIIQGYGMTEMKVGFGECGELAGLHLNPKYWLWEIVDKDTKEPVGLGQPGVIVFSHIGWRGTVFLRYYTGDFIEGGMVWERCPNCGYFLPRLQGNICRAEKDFTKLKGARVPLIRLISSVRDTPGVHSFQIILTKEDESDEFSRDKLLIRIVPEKDASRDELKESLKKNVKLETEVTPDEIIFEEDAEKFEQELFARIKIKAEYIIEKRPTHL